jgi:hypothetical protein
MRGISRGLEHHAQLKAIVEAAIENGYRDTIVLQPTGKPDVAIGDMTPSLFAERITAAATFNGPATVHFGRRARKNDDNGYQFIEVEGMEIVSWSMAPWLASHIV